MLNFKTTALAVMALSSSVAFAGTMGPMSGALNVTVPAESNGWEVGGHALYLKLNGPDIYGTKAVTNVAASPTTFTNGVEPTYDWGFVVDAAYRFGTGNDLNVNWYHIAGTSSNTVSYFGPSLVDNVGVGLYGVLISDATAAANGGATLGSDPTWDAVNIELGQRVTFSEGKNVRFHGGAQWARLAGNSQYTTPVGNTTTFVNGLANSASNTETAITTATYFYQQYQYSFNGFGPRLGSSFSYDVGYGLDIYADAAGSVLAGTYKPTNVLKFATASTAAAGWGGSSTASQSIVVPALEGKLGAKYKHSLEQGDVTLDAGWLFANYFLTAGNFGIEGLYFGLSFTGNMI
jgi:Legionella pneumophila major outer membrane protein precursor